MDLRPFTKEEQRFAEENHDLVYAFLNEKKLSEDEYYDVVVFGYLQAVQVYCRKRGQCKYSFSTLGWRHMQDELNDYHKYLSSAKRNAIIVSFEEPLDGNDGLRLEDVISYDDYLSELREDLLMHELATHLPEREMRIVKMKVRGAKLQEIAKSEKLNFKQIGEILDNIYPTVRKIFYG